MIDCEYCDGIGCWLCMMKPSTADNDYTQRYREDVAANEVMDNEGGCIK